MTAAIGWVDCAQDKKKRKKEHKAKRRSKDQDSGGGPVQLSKVRPSLVRIDPRGMLSGRVIPWQVPHVAVDECGVGRMVEPQFMAEGDDDGPRSVVSGEKVRCKPRTVASSSCHSLPAGPSLVIWTCWERVGRGIRLRRDVDAGCVAHRCRSR